MMNDSNRRAQLAQFLKYRRSKVSPDQVGFASGLRRRTPGLRREEVAELAGVGHVWYTWLEQGRPITPSTQVLESLAQALRLNDDERTYLFRLARPQGAQANPAELTSVPDRIVAMIKLLKYQPAYVRNVQWDLLAWNDAHAKVFGDYSCVPQDQRNMLWLLFTEARIRAMTLNWEVVAQQVIARFRADLSKNPQNKRANELTENLAAASPDFAKWWSQYRTVEILTHPIELDHPRAGRVSLERLTLRTETEPAQDVIVYMPLDAPSTKRLEAFCV